MRCLLGQLSQTDCGVLLWQSRASLYTALTACTAQVKRMQEVRRNLGLPDDARQDSLLEEAALQLAPSAELLTSFISACAQRYQRKSVDPGEPDACSAGLARGPASSGGMHAIKQRCSWHLCQLMQLPPWQSCFLAACAECFAGARLCALGRGKKRPRQLLSGS